MPQYQDPAAADALRYLRGRVDSLQKEVDFLKSGQGAAFLPRGDHENYPNPAEGQTMVNYLTDTPYHYARGAWHPFGGSSVAWMAVFDNFYYGQDIGSADGATNLEYPFCDWSDNAAGIFDWTRAAGSVADNTYNIQLLVDGVYTFTSWLISEDLGVSNYEIRYYIDTGCFYPARYSGQSDIVDREIITADFQMTGGADRSYSSPYVYYQRSFTLPLQIPFGNSPATVYPYVVLLRPSADADYNMTLRNRLWVTYHGPLNHAIGLTAGDHENYSPYDATGGPIHPPDHTTSN